MGDIALISKDEVELVKKEGEQMHNTELMMSLIVASTTLAGLQAVFVNQMVRSRLIGQTIRVSLRMSTVVALILTVLTVYGTANWLITESGASLSIAAWSFSLQLLTFLGLAGVLLGQAVWE